MSPTQAIQTVLRKYADFSGRANRSEYWWWWGALLVTFIVIGGISAVIGDIGYVLATVIGLAVFIPNLAVTVRRLHDTGRSGWWLLIVFVPAIGALILLVFTLLDSESGSNQWGELPFGSAQTRSAA
jgi:uncharacterized membrane protein YhaH (DUF805 family)